MPNLKSIYSNSMANLREEGTTMLSLMSCNLIKPKKSETSIYERRTIQSNQISTISSLIENDPGSPASRYNPQRENYGLYALKCNRNAIKRHPMTNLLQETAKSHQRPPTPPSPIHDVNHEAFSPCQSSADTHETMNSLNYHREYYKIEFSEEGGLKEVSNKVAIEFRSNCNQRAIDSGNDNSTVLKVPPPRKKKFSAPPICGDEKIFISQPKCHQHVKQLKSLTPNDISTGTQHHTVSDRKKAANVIGDPWRVPSDSNKLTLKKNRSELFRIRDRMFSSSLDSNSGESMESNHRQFHRLTKQNSINIFDNNNCDEDVFEDFNDVLSVEPVVEVVQPSKITNSKTSHYFWRDDSYASVFSSATESEKKLAAQSTSPKIVSNDFATISLTENYKGANDKNFEANFNTMPGNSQQTDEGDGLCIQICNNRERVSEDEPTVWEHRNNNGNRLPTQNVYIITNLVTV